MLRTIGLHSCYMVLRVPCYNVELVKKIRVLNEKLGKSAKF